MFDYETGLTAGRLRTLLRYSPETGEFYWLVTNSARRPAGSLAGDLKPSGYVLIGIDGFRYRAHRLAWLYMTGEWPADQVDHKDNVRSHNWWSNLRIADNAKNQANSRRPKNNTSGFKGVYWSTQREKWAAKINPDRRQVHLGFYDDPRLAHEAYKRAAAHYFGDFARAA
jgi:hypothetical protein